MINFHSCCKSSLEEILALDFSYCLFCVDAASSFRLPFSACETSKLTVIDLSRAGDNHSLDHNCPGLDLLLRGILMAMG